jgi:hypothetical protein
VTDALLRLTVARLFLGWLMLALALEAADELLAAPRPEDAN